MDGDRNRSGQVGGEGIKGDSRWLESECIWRVGWTSSAVVLPEIYEGGASEDSW